MRISDLRGGLSDLEYVKNLARFRMNGFDDYGTGQ